MMINLTSFKKQLGIHTLYLLVGISLMNTKQLKGFSCSSFCNEDFHNFLILLDSIFPFLPLSFVPVFSSLPPAHLL